MTFHIPLQSCGRAGHFCPPPVPLPGIGTFWYGPELSKLERACLRSMMQQGHEVTLFVHHEVKGVPTDVQICNAKEITGDRPIVLSNSKNRTWGSPVLYADQFRYHMIKKTDLLWADTDMFLLKPLQPTNGYLFARESEKVISNAILSLPENSPTLADLIEFCEDYYPIPPFQNKKKILKLTLRKKIGFPIHVSRQRRGVWGPSALTWFLCKNQEDHHALPVVSFHPIQYKGMDSLLAPVDETRERYLRNALSVHLWGSWLRKEMKNHTIPKGSFLSYILNAGS